MCFPGRGTHITKDMCFPGTGTHITRDSCFPGGGTHITRDMRFYSLERRFFVLEYRKKEIFLAYIALKKKVGKTAIFRQKKNGLTPLEKNFPGKKKTKKEIFLAYIALKKSWKNGHF